MVRAARESEDITPKKSRACKNVDSYDERLPKSAAKKKRSQAIVATERNDRVKTAVSKRVEVLRQAEENLSPVPKIRRSLIDRGRAKKTSTEEQSSSSSHPEADSTDDEEKSTPRTPETPTTRSSRLAGETTPLIKLPYFPKRKSTSTPETSQPKNLKMNIRKSVVRRGREAAALESDSEEEVEEATTAATDEVGPLKSREIEFETINSWIASSIKNEEALAVYISGTPGTGKTATMKLVLKGWVKQAPSTIINCVSIKLQKDLIEAIFASQNHSRPSTLPELEKFLRSRKKPMILVLDEIDHLASNSNSLLYSAFKWPHQVSTKLLVIGIANSIDLTERLLPKLKLAQPPKTLVFAPYTKENIREILEDKMNQEEHKLDAKAVELCARKVAAMSGDLRTALHVVKTTKASKLASGADGANSECREVLGVLNSVYSSPLARARLPFQPRLLLAVCLCMSTNKKAKLTSNSIFSGYVKACEAVKVPPLENDDLATAFQTLESQSFISQSSSGQIRLQVDSKTARSAISDIAMIEQVSTLKL